MTPITAADRAAFRERGFVVIPAAIDDRHLAMGRRTAAAMLMAEPPAAGLVGPYFLWPRFAVPPDDGQLTMRADRAGDAPNCDHGLLRLYRQTGLGELAADLLRPDLPPEQPEFAQLATTIPPWPHRPGGPHVDGISLPLPDGTPATFSLLVGAWLSDHSESNCGNLWVWPGTHLRFGAYLARRGADALSKLYPEPYPPVELGEPVQVTGPAGSVLFAHYLLAHNIGGYDGPPDAPMRQVVYYRLQASGHQASWRTAVTDPMGEFRQS